MEAQTQVVVLVLVVGRQGPATALQQKDFVLQHRGKYRRKPLPEHLMASSQQVYQLDACLMTALSQAHFQHPTLLHLAVSPAAVVLLPEVIWQMLAS